MASLRDLVLGNINVVIGSRCTGYGGLDLGLLMALGRRRIAWAAVCDPHVGAILAARMRGVPNLGDVRQIDWSDVEPVDLPLPRTVQLRALGNGVVPQQAAYALALLLADLIELVVSGAPIRNGQEATAA